MCLVIYYKYCFSNIKEYDQRPILKNIIKNIVYMQLTVTLCPQSKCEEKQQQISEFWHIHLRWLQCNQLTLQLILHHSPENIPIRKTVCEVCKCLCDLWRTVEEEHLFAGHFLNLSCRVLMYKWRDFTSNRREKVTNSRASSHVVSYQFLQSLCLAL